MSRFNCMGRSINKEAENNIFDWGPNNNIVIVNTPAKSSVINLTNKNRVMMRDVIIKYHPLFKIAESLRDAGLADPDMFNVPRLVEQSLAAVGGYTVVNAYGYDFSDYSDSKTTTVSQYDKILSIGNVQNKIGALRVTTYNPFTNKLDYFYLPQSFVVKYREDSCKKNDRNGERIRTSWTKKTDHYRIFESYRLSSFEELALAK